MEEGLVTVELQIILHKYKADEEKSEERLSVKTKTAGNSAQNLTDFLIISSFTGIRLTDHAIVPGALLMVLQTI